MGSGGSPSPKPPGRQKGPVGSNNRFASSALRDGDEDQTFPGEQGFFSVRIDAGLEDIFKEIVMHAMARAPGMPGNANDIALRIACNCPGIIKSMLESFSSSSWGIRSLDRDSFFNKQKAHLSKVWFQGSTSFMTDEDVIVAGVSEGEGEDKATLIICFHNIAEKELWESQLDRLHKKRVMLTFAALEHPMAGQKWNREWLQLYDEFVRAWGIHRTLPSDHITAHQKRNLI